MMPSTHLPAAGAKIIFMVSICRGGKWFLAFFMSEKLTVITHGRCLKRGMSAEHVNGL